VYGKRRDGSSNEREYLLMIPSRKELNDLNLYHFEIIEKNGKK